MVYRGNLKKNLISKRDKGLTTSRKMKLLKKLLMFRKLRNHTQCKLQKTKRNSIKNQIKENKQSPKKLWQTLKNLGLSTKSKLASKCIGLMKMIMKKNSMKILFLIGSIDFFCNIPNELVQKC